LVFECLDSPYYVLVNDVFSFRDINKTNYFNYLCMISIYLSAISVSALLAFYLKSSSNSDLLTFLSNYFIRPLAPGGP